MFRRVPWRSLAALAGILAITFSVPLAGRVAAGLYGRDAADRPSYLPSLEAARPRAPFAPGPIDDLREVRPGIVLVGDSMGGRIDEHRLEALAETPVWPLLMNATGSAYWYLSIKNYVVPSGVRPSWILVFFRDTNLTDVAFRLDGPYRAALDMVALDAEPELDRVVARRTAGAWAPVMRATESVYHLRTMRTWLEPMVNAWPARLLAPAGREGQLVERVNAAFSLDKMRSAAQADLALSDDREADFAGNVDRSVLPLMLELAARHDLRICFVRVMRRPVQGQPPPTSPALTRYIEDLGAYVRQRGAFLLDDQSEPSLARLPYADGDHVSRDARVPYTDSFWPRLRALAP